MPPPAPVFDAKRETITFGADVFTLEINEAKVLEILVPERTATLSRLRKSGIDRPDRVLRSLVKEHPALTPFVRFPGKRGMGGYGTSITLKAD